MTDATTAGSVTLYTSNMFYGGYFLGFQHFLDTFTRNIANVEGLGGVEASCRCSRN